MLENWKHGYLYAVTPSVDPLAEPPEPYLAHETVDGWRFLHAPHLAADDGPHAVSHNDLELARSQGFALRPRDVLSLWSDRHYALVAIARAYGILPSPPGVLADAEQWIRTVTPHGRLAERLRAHRTWPNSTVHVHTSHTGVFESAVIVLRTTNPYQLRSMLVMLGADREDIADLTGITR